MRLLLKFLFSMLIAQIAQAECSQRPIPETSEALLRSFGTRMSIVGADDWRFAIETQRGTMYYSKDTEVRLFIKTIDGLIEEAGLLLPNLRTAEAARFEAAAVFLGSRLSGLPEASWQHRVSQAIIEIQKNDKPQTIREGDNTLVFSAPTKGTIAVIAGRLHCD